MAKVLQNIWILTDHGITVFSSISKMVDDQAFGMAMSALNLFAKEFSKGSGIRTFELSDKRFNVLKKNNFLFIASSSNKIKEKKVIHELQSIIDKFFAFYPKKLLDNWKGDINIFDNFRKEIVSSLQKRK